MKFGLSGYVTAPKTRVPCWRIPNAVSHYSRDVTTHVRGSNAQSPIDVLPGRVERIRASASAPRTNVIAEL